MFKYSRCSCWSAAVYYVQSQLDATARVIADYCLDFENPPISWLVSRYKAHKKVLSILFTEKWGE